MNEVLEKAAFNEPTTERASLQAGLGRPSNDELQIESDTQPVDVMADAEIGTPIGNGFGSTRDIKITPLSSGFLVKVGCQSIAIETNEKLVSVMAKYLDNPNDFEKRWFSKDVRNRLENIL